MARGFLSGVLWGGLLSVGVSGAASVLAPPPMPPQVSDTAPGAAEAPARIEQASSGEAGSSSDRAPVTAQSAPQAPQPDPDKFTGVDDTMTTPAAQPETADVAALDAPATAAEGTGVTVQADDPVLPNPQALAPMEPEAADELSIITEPAQPPAPEVEAAEGAFETPAETDATAPEAPQAQVEQTPETPAPVQAAEAPQEPEAEPQAEVAPPAHPTAVAPEDATTEETAVQEPQIAPVAPPPAIVADAPPADASPVEDTDIEAAATEDAAEDTAEETSARPAIGTPAVTLTDRAAGVTVNRPGSADAPEAEAAETAETEAVEGAQEGDPRPIVRFAEPFEEPGDKPLMGIVLIDTGTSPVSGAAGIAALRSFPYPLSFAVDASLPDAGDRMAIYRAAGFEVLAMVDLPEGAAATDAETTFAVALPKLPEAVAVLEGTGGGVQGSKEVADQVTAILAQTGHGLVTQDKGLNTMPKLAVREGVPAAPVFRDFDSKDQSAAVIRRFLDQAAFKASQEGAVIMLGRMRPDTISALLLWGLQDRASTVALAPISAVLTREP